MTKVFSYTQPIHSHVTDAFCALQQGFTDQFVYYSKERPFRFMGLGRCIAVESLAHIDYELQGPSHIPPTLFTFKRFDEGNPALPDELFQTFPNLNFLLPEVVLIENEEGTFLQVNSLGPVYEGRVARFVDQAAEAPAHQRTSIAYVLQPDSPSEWLDRAWAALAAISEGRVRKVVPCRRIQLQAEASFSSKDVLLNLIDGPAKGTVFMYRYGSVFFCGCTPELLVRKNGQNIESMCLAGTCAAGTNEAEREEFANWLLSDTKNLNEHAFVVDFLRQVCERNCYNVDIPQKPSILSLTNVQHLYTPVHAQVMEGKTIQNIADQLHPTPALSGTPVGEALMLLREIEPFSRGFFGGSVGVVDAADNGEYSVAIRCGVFDGICGWLYAGCGIVEGSNPQSEYDEIDMKLQTILSAFDGGN